LRRVQAVLIAGGLGTRLRPLTLTRPKALLPLVNRPMVLHILDRLPASVDEVILAANYRTEQLREFFAKQDVGRTVTIVREKRRLGTGGCLKNLEDRLSGTFLAFNGDVISSLAASDLLAAHRRLGGIGTIALWEVADPSAFGVVALDGERITKFVEKPPKEEAPSNLVNAGAYALEREVLAGIPKGEPASLEVDVFPKVVRKGLHGFRFSGYWADAGTLENFLRATEILLRTQGSEVSHRAKVLPTVRLNKPVAVAGDAMVEGEIGPVAVLGAGSVVRGRVSRSVLFDRARVEEGATVSGCIVGEGATIGPRSTVSDSVIADGAVVEAESEVVGERVKA